MCFVLPSFSSRPVFYKTCGFIYRLVFIMHYYRRVNSKEPLHIYNETIERVTQFTYLGSIIDNTGGTEADIMARIRKAQIAFSALNKIWQSTTYSAQTKLRVFNTNVKAVLLYGCKTWKNSKYTWSVRKVSDRIFLCEHLMDYNLARLHEPTLNLSAHA